MSRLTVALVVAFVGSLAGAGCASCQTHPAPPPPPPDSGPPVVDAGPPLPPATTTATTVYNELVEAGILASDPNGPAYVQGEYNSDVREPWLACMFDGGSVQACGVLTASSVRRRDR